MGNLIIRNGGSLTIQGDSLSILDTTLQSGQLYQQGDVYYGFTDFSEYTTFDHGDSNPNSDLVEWRAAVNPGNATHSISVGNDATYGNYVAYAQEAIWDGFGERRDGDTQGVAFTQFGEPPGTSSMEVLSLIYAEKPMTSTSTNTKGFLLSATSHFVSSSITSTNGYYHLYHSTGTLSTPPAGWRTIVTVASGSEASAGASFSQDQGGDSILKANDMPHWVWARFQWYINTSNSKINHRYKMWTGSYTDEPSTYWVPGTPGQPAPQSTSDWFETNASIPTAPGYLAFGGRAGDGYGYYYAEGRIAYLSFSTDSGSVPAPPPPAGL